MTDRDTAIEFLEYLRKSGYSDASVKLHITTTTEMEVVVDGFDEAETERLWDEFMAAKSLGPIDARPH